MSGICDSVRNLVCPFGRVGCVCVCAGVGLNYCRTVLHCCALFPFFGDRNFGWLAVPQFHMDLQDMGLVQRMTLSLCFSLALGFNITCLELVKKHPVAKKHHM